MKTILLLGSNLQNPLQQLDTAKLNISKHVTILRESSIYKTAAWGNTNQDDFYNQALEIESDIQPEELMLKFIEIEELMGRRRIDKWEPRIIDIDIIAIDDLVLNTEKLVVPHPHLQNRMFVLIPMQEIWNNWEHPILNKNINELLISCEDKLPVIKFS